MLHEKIISEKIIQGITLANITDMTRLWRHFVENW